MSNKKKLNKEELSKATGGVFYRTCGFDSCPKCHKVFNTDKLDSREIKENCDTIIEYQCPECQQWFH